VGANQVDPLIRRLFPSAYKVEHRVHAKSCNACPYEQASVVMLFKFYKELSLFIQLLIIYSLYAIRCFCRNIVRRNR